MTESLISLKTTMKRCVPFEHEFMDEVGKGFYDLTPEQIVPVLERYLETRTEDDKYVLTMSHMWLVRDLVGRFRAHFPEMIPMTDDVVSVGIEAVSEFLMGLDEKLCEKIEGKPTQQQFFSKLQAFIHERMRAYINDNRSAFGACFSTNWQRQKSDEPLEYGFAAEVSDEIMGSEVNDPYLVDVLDAIEQLNDVDAEEMRDLVLHFLKQNHNIDEEELSAEERSSLERLTEFVRNAGL